MSTRSVVEGYYQALRSRGDWQTFLADDMAFISHVSPARQLAGKKAYLEGTQRFFSMIDSVTVRELIIDGEKACALTRYGLQSPRGRFESDVAEILTVRGGKIDSFAIYFDSAPFPKQGTT